MKKKYLGVKNLVNKRDLFIVTSLSQPFCNLTGGKHDFGSHQLFIIKVNYLIYNIIVAKFGELF